MQPHNETEKRRGRPPMNIPKSPTSDLIGSPALTERETRSNFSLTREPERLSKEDVDTRDHGTYWEFPDFNGIEIDPSSMSFQLMAPPPRKDPKYGKMRQYWCNPHINKGNRFAQMLKQGWIPRHPATVDPAFPLATQKWHGRDVIGVSDDAILMEIPESQYQKMEEALLKLNRQKIVDIQGTHGKSIVNGQMTDRPIKSSDNYTPGNFAKEVLINRNNDGGGDVAFAD